MLPAALVASAQRRLGEIADCSEALLALRAVKDAGEIEAMRASVDAVRRAARGDVRAPAAGHHRARAVRRARAGAAPGRPRRRRLPAPLGREARDGGRARLGREPLDDLARPDHGHRRRAGRGVPDGRLAPRDPARRPRARRPRPQPGRLPRRHGAHATRSARLPDGMRRLARSAASSRTSRSPRSAPASPRARSTTRRTRPPSGSASRTSSRAAGPYIGHGIGLELDEPPVLGPGRRDAAAGGHGPRRRAQADLAGLRRGQHRGRRRRHRGRLRDPRRPAALPVRRRRRPARSRRSPDAWCAGVAVGGPSSCPPGAARASLRSSAPGGPAAARHGPSCGRP